MSVAASTWPIERLGEAIAVLADRAGYTSRSGETTHAPVSIATANDEAIARFAERTAEALGIEADAVDAPMSEVEAFVRRSAPILLRTPGAAPSYLAIARVTGARAHVIAPDLQPQILDVAAIVRVLVEQHEAEIADDVDHTLVEAGLRGRSLTRARAVLMSERLRDRWIRGALMLSLPPSTRFSDLLRRAFVPQLLTRVLVIHALQYVGMLLAWWMVGRAALSGRVEPGWLAAWALLLLTLVPLRSLATWYQGRLTLEGGALLKQRLLIGALKLEPEEIRHQGSGELFGRVAESEAVERLALTGGLDAFVAIVELVLAGGVLALGVAPLVHPFLLGGWLAGTAIATIAYDRQRARWSESRIGMTNDLVERMVGHRTRLAQEDPARWHDGEDQALALYHERSQTLDRGAALLLGFVPRGWLLVGTIALLPAFITSAGDASAIAALAIAVGGLLLSFRALSGLTQGLAALVAARIAWREVAPLFDAASRPTLIGRPDIALQPATDASGLVLDASDLVFGYPGRGEPVIRGCDLKIKVGDRVLLQGRSGGGKTTLAALLTGLRTPQSGLVLLRGLDRKTLGSAEWMRRIGAAPQFHENHVMTETVAFNLLMGRAWPPTPDDLRRAESICRELGLGELLERMPAGMQQMVGDTGWQLSHGERSRIYIARALLQDADLVVLDESFAALDPANLSLALRCVIDRARSVLVIAHP